jgi:hypothetical protein
MTRQGQPFGSAKGLVAGTNSYTALATFHHEE